VTQQRLSRRSVACSFLISSKPSAFCRHIARNPRFFDLLRHAVLPSLAAILLVLGMAVPTVATTWTVTSKADSGTGTLRGALRSAASGDTINFSLTYPATITLTSGYLSIGTNVTISGPGPANLFISGSGESFGVFYVKTGVTTTVSGVTIENGANLTYGGGGGITNLGTLTVRNSTFSGNSAPAGNGGGIENFGSATVINSTFSVNSVGSGSFGGGIGSNGALTLKNTLLAGQTSGRNCYLFSGTTTSGGYNLSDDSTCSSFFITTGDQNALLGLFNLPQGADPGLDSVRCLTRCSNRRPQFGRLLR
jgi:hypothetical protein